MSLTTDPILLEKEMEYDLKLGELTDKYKADVGVINECINKLVDIREDRTAEYEMDILKLKGAYGY